MSTKRKSTEEIGGAEKEHKLDSEDAILNAARIGDVHLLETCCRTVTMSLAELAVYHRQPAALEWILAKNPDLILQNNDLLFFAIQHQQAECVEIMLKAKADVNCPKYSDKIGCSSPPLMWAVRYNSPACVHVLVMHPQIDLDAETEYKSNALTMAAYSGYPECIKLLIDTGANVNHRGIGDITALIWASRWRGPNYALCAKFLLDAGADPNLKDERGHTALEWAVSNGNEPQVRDLLHSRVNLNDTVSDGGTIWDISTTPVIKDLLEKAHKLFYSQLSSSHQIYF